MRDANEYEHRDGCMVEHTWDEDDCNCRQVRFDSHVEALDAATEERLDGDTGDQR